MNNILKYKGYTGSVNFNADDMIFHGRVLGITDVVGFEGTTVENLKADFQDAVDDYLEACADFGKEPEKPFSGKFVVRVPPELHAKLAIMARQTGKSLNSFVKDRLEKIV